ncbi:unspecific monooxygenase [Ancylostoma caninum]|uniref:Unspecific monooxygenase n=1 Tax=Ancylostoma caninum TaxID=29170 RepID=A0A368FVC9_ANCCA|nr:unspecific monooxygenase [Ancylostoma caninum]
MKRSASAVASAIASSACPVAGVPANAKATNVRPFEEIPGPTISSRLFGRNRVLFRSRHSIAHYYDWLVDLHKRYGPLVRVNQGFGRGYIVHVFDPEDSRQVFASDGRQPFTVPLQETTQRYREIKGMNPGLGNLNGDEWYRLRSSIQQVMMRPQAVQKYLPYTNEVAAALVDHIRSESFCRWALESAALTVFEKRLGALSDRIDWADMLVDLNKSIFQLSAELRFAFPFYRYFSTPKWRKMVELEDKFYREANLLIDDAINKLRGSSQSEEEMKFASLLINRKELNVKDVAIILLSMFSDGLSTAAPMLIYNLFNIATNPNVQDELREEVNAVLNCHREITPTDLSQLPFLRACIKETFRLFPIGTEISRIPQKDLVLSGYRVPAGTPVDVNTNVLMRSLTLFDDPLSFRPTRWLRDGSRPDSHPFSFLPFGFGPRMCAGRRFAEQDLQVTLCCLVQHFRISHHHSPIEQIYETLLLPKGCCDFHFEQI